MNITIPEVLELLEVEPPTRLPGHIPCTAHDENTASMWVSEDRFWAFCCGTGGDAIDLVRFVTGATFGQAKRFLEGVMDVEYVRPERAEREIPDLSERFLAETAHPSAAALLRAEEFVALKWSHLDLPYLRHAFGVGVTEHALWIPHTDHEGVVRGIKTRSTYNGNKLAVEGSCITTRLYRGLGKVAAPNKVAIITEGESDTWTMTRHYEASPLHVVFGLPAGAKTWKETFALEASQCARVELWLDSDQTGRQAAAKILEDLQGRGVVCEDRELPLDYGDVTEAYMDGWRPA